MDIKEALIREKRKTKDYYKTELGEIKALANAEYNIRNANREIENYFIHFKKNGDEKIILNELRKNIFNIEKKIRKIKGKKMKELLDKYKEVPKDIEERLNNTKELGIPKSILKDIDSILDELNKKSEVPSYWYKIEWRGCSTCRIIDKDTKIPIITTDINIVQKIIEDTFGTETAKELKERADREWEKILTINNNMYCGVGLKRVNTYSCITYLDENRKLVI